MSERWNRRRGYVVSICRNFSVWILRAHSGSWTPRTSPAIDQCSALAYAVQIYKYSLELLTLHPRARTRSSTSPPLPFSSLPPSSTPPPAQGHVDIEKNGLRIKQGQQLAPTLLYQAQPYARTSRSTGFTACRYNET